jgi:hypothetical protein
LFALKYDKMPMHSIMLVVTDAPADYPGEPLSSMVKTR